MSRWIDADALKARKKLDGKTYRYFINMTDFYSAPTIDLVRCKECRHWNEEDHWCDIRDSYGWDYKADDYCSYGEREGE